jgi:hypothetical protein
MRTIPDNMKHAVMIIMGGKEPGDSCPEATQDVTLNLKNREKAITKAAYGPENPKLPNTEFWMKKAQKWDVSAKDAKMSRCGNCSAFNQSTEIDNCIAEGIGDEGDPWAVIEAGDLGYCEIFDFKCASSRTCDAWIVEDAGEVDTELK